MDQWQVPLELFEEGQDLEEVDEREGGPSRWDDSCLLPDGTLSGRVGRFGQEQDALAASPRGEELAYC